MQPSNEPHFLLVGHEGCHNRGCEALVRTTVSILREEFPGAYFAIASSYPENDVPLLDIKGLQVIPGLCRSPFIYQSHTSNYKRNNEALFNWKLSLYRFAAASVPNGLIPRLRNLQSKVHVLKLPFPPRPNTEEGFNQVRHLKQTMLSATAVILIGGDMLNETQGSFIHSLESIEYAQFLGRKTVIWGSSFWPYNSLQARDRVKTMLQHCTLVTVRDESSYKYLESLGIKTNVSKVADGAFLMPPRPSEQAYVNWTSPPSFVVGFAGSSIFNSYLSSQGYSKKKIRQAIFTLTDFFQDIVDNQNAGVILVPHDAFPGSPERDFLYEIMLLINRPNSVYMPPIGLPARETKALIGKCDYFIGMRFHATIAALSQSIPTLALSHSPKFTGLYKEIYGNIDYLVRYEDISSDVLSEKLDALQTGREDIRKMLAIRIPQLHTSARYGGQYLKSLLS